MTVPGTLALLGSGETSSQGRKIHDYLLARIGATPVRLALVETPAGFQPNAHDVYAKIGEFMEKSLQNFRPHVEYVAAHRKGSVSDPDSPSVAEVLGEAQYIFSGPGSPTYAARELSDTLTLHCIAEAYRRGATVTLSSAAAIAAGSLVIRVYEIFKAGADLGWDEGLHLLPLLGLDIDPVIVTHWNNAEGGAGLDTSHCYVGSERFETLLGMLSEPLPILGIDEHTACILEAGSGTAKVLGAGTVTVINGSDTLVVRSGESFALDLLRKHAASPATSAYLAPIK